ncbi:hypothetical protein SVAN01_01510 [Stagonosporopsis vannaccii]|nr:hypothetical protein SVAN01_01510 [Stagonosporopsis vannaccii]
MVVFNTASHLDTIKYDHTMSKQDLSRTMTGYTATNNSSSFPSAHQSDVTDLRRTSDQMLQVGFILECRSAFVYSATALEESFQLDRFEPTTNTIDLTGQHPLGDIAGNATRMGSLKSSGIDRDTNSIMASTEQDTITSPGAPASSTESAVSVKSTTQERTNSNDQHARHRHIKHSTPACHITRYKPKRGWGWRPPIGVLETGAVVGQRSTNIVNSRKKISKKRSSSLHCWIPGEGWTDI